MGNQTYHNVIGQRLNHLKEVTEKISLKLEDMLEIHLLGCDVLGHRNHMEGGQQAEQTDEDSRACCWLLVGHPGGGSGAEVHDST